MVDILSHYQPVLLHPFWSGTYPAPSIRIATAVCAEGDRSLPPPFEYQFTALIPRESGKAEPSGGFQAPGPFSHTLTTAHSAICSAVGPLPEVGTGVGAVGTVVVVVETVTLGMTAGAGVDGALTETEGGSVVEVVVVGVVGGTTTATGPTFDDGAGDTFPVRFTSGKAKRTGLDCRNKCGVCGRYGAVPEAVAHGDPIVATNMTMNTTVSAMRFSIADLLSMWVAGLRLLLCWFCYGLSHLFIQGPATYREG